MDRDKQLSLNFEPPSEPVLPMPQCLLTGDTQRTVSIAGAKILQMPSAVDRARKVSSELEAELLERVLRRAWYF
ncbi:hypothetical protein BTHphiE094_046 [Burkholderia phage phiE094]|uniref:Uncharacterized protein n=1 Tax=Burkholderia phage phiE094 TaxID=2781364 RepID=A0A876A863_9CAUD|nr:hypothetical protein KNV69_gp46 [Burkholderia phage phiE094]QPI18583.1 hypothetical protein BTHphiE094_046 [Burkholderia phage phiE094]